MAEHNKTGNKGETLAREHLESKGYEILETNWRFQRAEIDIIAKHSNMLIIAEVKARSSEFWGEPETFVSRKKQGLIVKAANAFIAERNIDLETRFDVIAVLISPKGHQLKHIEDAFYPLA